MNPKGRPENLKSWVKGQSGNPLGRPKDHVTPATFRRDLGKLWTTALLDVQAIAKDPEAEMGEAIVAACLLEAHAKGDTSRLAVLLDRLIGKPKEVSDDAAGGTDVKGILESLTPDDQKAYLELVARAVTRARAS